MAEPDRTTFRNFIVFWVGQLVSLAGTNIVTFSLTWWITVQTGSAFFLGLSAFFAFGSFILITPLAGVLVDRWSRKKVIIVADTLLAILSIILIFLFVFGVANIIHVLIIQLIGGMIGAFHVMAVQAITPMMVPKDRLSRMNSAQYFATGLIQTIGPVIGALVFTLFLGNMAQIMLIDIVTYIAAIIPTILIVIPVVVRKAVEKPSMRKEFSEGFTFIRERRGLLTLLSIFAVANFLLPGVFVLLPLYSGIVLAGGDPIVAVLMLAALMSIQSISMMIASGIMSVYKGFKRNTVGVVLGLLFGAVGLIVLALTPPGLFWVAAIGMFLIGFTLPIANISSQTIWQKVTPPEKIGRVFSVRTMIAQFTGPFAFLVGGILGTIYPIPLVFLVFGITMVIVLALAWTFTSLPRVEETLEENEVTKEKDRAQK